MRHKLAEPGASHPPRGTLSFPIVLQLALTTLNVLIFLNTRALAGSLATERTFHTTATPTAATVDLGSALDRFTRSMDGTESNLTNHSPFVSDPVAKDQVGIYSLTYGTVRDFVSPRIIAALSGGAAPSFAFTTPKSGDVLGTESAVLLQGAQRGGDFNGTLRGLYAHADFAGSGNGATIREAYGLVADIGHTSTGDGYNVTNAASILAFQPRPERIGTFGSAYAMYALGDVAVGGDWSNPAVLLGQDGTISLRGPERIEAVHPTQPGMTLVHSSLIGPEAAVYYRGEAQLSAGQAVVRLPDYFEAFTRRDQRTVMLANVDGFEPITVVTQNGAQIENGAFIVRASDPRSAQRFNWEVWAVRADVPVLQVEKRRDSR